jgi:hypothetical protein
MKRQGSVFELLMLVATGMKAWIYQDDKQVKKHGAEATRLCTRGGRTRSAVLRNGTGTRLLSEEFLPRLSALEQKSLALETLRPATGNSTLVSGGRQAANAAAISCLWIQPFTTLFGGTESLARFWSNMAKM